MSDQLPLMSGTQNKALSQWFTPRELAVKIVEWALRPGALPAPNVLRAFEPSAGRGALAVELRRRGCSVTCCEIDKANEDHLLALGFEVWGGDFFDVGEAIPRFDLAVMNPPFEGGQTEQHIMHALKFADRVVCHCPLTTLAGKARRASLWSKVELHRLAICSTRPKYGPDGGKTDMCTIDVMLSEGWEHPAAQPKVEWWP
jgi:predicted RNA methylase